MVSELGPCWSHLVHRRKPVRDVPSHRSILDVADHFESSHRRARDGTSGLAARERIQSISHRFPVCENRSQRDTDLRISRETFRFATCYGSIIEDEHLWDDCYRCYNPGESLSYIALCYKLCNYLEV